MIDWPLARRIAVAVAGRGAHPLSTAELPRLASESERLVEDYTGLSPAAPLPMPEAVTRGQWAVLNLNGFEPLLDPSPSGSARASARWAGRCARPAAP